LKKKIKNLNFSDFRFQFQKNQRKEMMNIFFFFLNSDFCQGGGWVHGNKCVKGAKGEKRKKEGTEPLKRWHCRQLFKKKKGIISQDPPELPSVLKYPPDLQKLSI
jgi:hypothetical protein